MVLADSVHLLCSLNEISIVFHCTSGVFCVSVYVYVVDLHCHFLQGSILQFVGK